MESRVTPAPSSPVPQSPAELADRWQAAVRDWAQWWGAVGAGGTGTWSATGAANLPTGAIAAATGVPHAEALATLNDNYRKRWEALWGAAADALARKPAGDQSIPAVAEPAPGDRRFAAPEWDQLPYFAPISLAQVHGAAGRNLSSRRRFSASAAGSSYPPRARFIVA